MKVQTVDFDVVPQVALWGELNMKTSKQMCHEMKEQKKSFSNCFSAFLCQMFLFHCCRSECSQPKTILSIGSFSLSACILCYEDGCLFLK